MRGVIRNFFCGDTDFDLAAGLAIPIPLNIYCDESSQTGHRYMVIGALCCRTDTAFKIATVFDETIQPFNVSSELKWTKVKRHSVRMYEEVMDAAFALIVTGHLTYQCIVIDTTKTDHKTYNEGDPEIGFNKYLFLLLDRYSYKYRSFPSFRAYLDRRETKHTPERMREMLNLRAAKRKLVYEPFSSVQFIRSENSRLIQVADIITGAIAYTSNRQFLAAEAAKYRQKMADYIAQHAEMGTLANETPFPHSLAGFGIWHLRWGQPRRRYTPRTRN